MKPLIWISYDLGVKGDYEGFYAWLDNHEAKECGTSIAVLYYEFSKNLIEELKKDLLDNVSFSKLDRIYLIWREDEKIKGRFLLGKRKAAPWSGYGGQESEIEEDS
ncbi:MAG: hypothetical protein ACMUIU_02505 [bacterium]